MAQNRLLWNLSFFIVCWCHLFAHTKKWDKDQIATAIFTLLRTSYTFARASQSQIRQTLIDSTMGFCSIWSNCDSICADVIEFIRVACSLLQLFSRSLACEICLSLSRNTSILLHLVQANNKKANWMSAAHMPICREHKTQPRDGRGRHRQSHLNAHKCRHYRLIENYLVLI